jgi:predicted RNA binding protein YcfA (HicA-like mRNA interferase family)
MNKKQTLFESAKSNPQGTKFSDLIKLATYVGFQYDRTKGSHVMYKRVTDPKDLMTFQKDSSNKSMAKGYQVKQLIRFIEDHNLQSMLEE